MRRGSQQTDAPRRKRTRATYANAPNTPENAARRARAFTPAAWRNKSEPWRMHKPSQQGQSGGTGTEYEQKEGQETLTRFGRDAGHRMAFQRQPGSLSVPR